MFKVNVRLLTVSAAALVASSNLAASQGVPIVDWKLLKENLAIIAHQEEDLAAQGEKKRPARNWMKSRKSSLKP